MQAKALNHKKLDSRGSAIWETCKRCPIGRLSRVAEHSLVVVEATGRALGLGVLITKGPGRGHVGLSSLAHDLDP